MNIQNYADVVNNDMTYMNERLRLQRSYIKNDLLRINRFIDIISNVIENIDRLALHKGSHSLKDKILALTLKYCNLQKNDGS